MILFPHYERYVMSIADIIGIISSVGIALFLSHPDKELEIVTWFPEVNK